MSQRLWTRAKLIYVVHVSLLILALLAAWIASGWLPPLANHFHFFLTHPLCSLVLSPLLMHQPPLFDILPLYVIFLAISPFALSTAQKYGWGKILAISASGWLAAQFNLNTPFESHVVMQSLRLGSFNLLAWQFLWICGLAIGETSLRHPIISSKYKLPLVVPASLIVAAGLLSRHGLWPPAWLPNGLFLWMDKWTLGPLRVLNFSSWVVLLLAWNPKVSPRLTAPLALLGRHSLAVFAAHLPLVIAASTFIQMSSLSNAGQTLAGLGVICALFLWAKWLDLCAQKQFSAPTLSQLWAGIVQVARSIFSPGQAAR